MSTLPARPLVDADSAIYFVTTNASGAPTATPAQLAETVGRAIASRYDYLATWGNGRSMSREDEARMSEAIGILRLEYFRLTGRAWIGE